MKKWSLVVISLLMLVACSKDPKGLPEAYFTYLDKGEITEAGKLLSKQVTAMAGEVKLKAMLQQQAKQLQQKGGINSISTEGETKGEMGEYTAHIVFKDGSKRDEKVSLIKEDDGWKISPK